MTRRRARDRAATLEASDFPALAAFARAYLHQDFEEEYGTPVAACDAYCADATPKERAALAADLSRLVALTPEPTLRALKRFFLQGLRTAWTPQTRAELEQLLNAVRKID